jgi:hypothetical protein
MMRQISVKEKKIHPPHPYIFNLKRSSPKPPLGRHHIKPKRGHPMRLGRRLLNLSKFLRHVLVILDRGLMPTR